MNADPVHGHLDAISLQWASPSTTGGSGVRLKRDYRFVCNRDYKSRSKPFLMAVDCSAIADYSSFPNYVSGQV